MPLLTLGCGTFGGTSAGGNVSYTHLQNIKRVMYGMDTASKHGPH